MKKKTPETPDYIQEMYEESKEYVEKHELGAYIGEHNEPRYEELDESQTVDAEDVLMLGSYLTMRKLMRLQSKQGVDVHIIGSGSMKHIPKEMKDAIIKALTEED